MCLGKPLNTAQSFGVRNETGLSQEGGFNSVRRGETRMVGFAHCSKLRLQTGRLGAGKPECVSCFFGIEAEQTATCCRRTKGS